MMDPRSHFFLDVKFKRARFLWWKYVTSSGPERRMRHTGSFASHMRQVRQVRVIHDCDHDNRRPGSARAGWRKSEVCLDCGAGIVYHPVRAA